VSNVKTDTQPLGLGIDAGGTQTRWALATGSGEVLASGHVDGLTALSFGSHSGREHMKKALGELGAAVLLAGKGQPAQIVAGMTGFDDGPERAELSALIAAPFDLTHEAVLLGGDVQVAYWGVFAPGEGYLVYAGTGSIAVYVDENGGHHRVGGLGGILDDAGSGFWIAIQALRAVWRAEDAQPGSAAPSPLGRLLFATIGGADWAASRNFVYAGGFEANRGKVGRLALAVAAAANAGDPAALRILAEAGAELAHLANVLVSRFGVRPVALAGRVFELHPMIRESVRTALPPTVSLEARSSEAHVAAAWLAARRAVGAAG
jgi:glucosamine kinase